MMWFDTQGSLGRVDPQTETFELYTPPRAPRLSVGGSLQEDGRGQHLGRQPPRRAEIRSRFPRVHVLPEQDRRRRPDLRHGRRPARERLVGAVQHGHRRPRERHDRRGGRGADAAARRARPRAAPDAGRPRLLPPHRRHCVSPAASTTPAGRHRAGSRPIPRATRCGSPTGGAPNLAKIDINTLEATYYHLPIGAHPYATVVDRNHMVWTNLSSDDAVARFDPVAEEYTIFKLPSLGAELRHIAVDDAGGPDVWGRLPGGQPRGPASSSGPRRNSVTPAPPAHWLRPRRTTANRSPHRRTERTSCKTTDLRLRAVAGRRPAPARRDARQFCVGPALRRARSMMTSASARSRSRSATSASAASATAAT